jgi:hypothetical protein
MFAYERGQRACRGHVGYSKRDIIDLTLVRSNFFSSLDEYKYAGLQIQQGTLSPNIGVSHIDLIESGGYTTGHSLGVLD